MAHKAKIIKSQTSKPTLHAYTLAASAWHFSKLQFGELSLRKNGTK
jgi:hypothetical protein